MKTNIDQIKKKAVPVLKEAGVTRSSLFGSVVRGEAKESSDVDILVELPRNMSLLDFVGLKIKLEEKLDKKVDLVEYNTIKPRLREQILNEQVQII